MKFIWKAIILYTFITIVVSWPIILKPFSHIYAIYGDSIGVLWYIWWPAFAIKKGISIFWSSYSAAPFSDYIRFLSADYFLALPFTLIFGEVFTYNLFIWLSFILAGLGMFLLVRYLLTNNSTKQQLNNLTINLASFLAGAIFAFSPYHYVRSTGHWDLAQIQWIPFFILFLIKYDRERKLKYLFLTIFFFLLAGLTSPYYGIFLPFPVIIYYIIKSIALRPRLSIKRIGIGVLGAVFITLILTASYHPFIKPLLYALPRPQEELKIWSLGPINYFLPSVDNPFLGHFSHFTVEKSLGGSNFTEKTAYLGILPFLLALFGFIRERKKYLTWFFVLTGLFAFWITLGPNGPGLLLYKIAPFVRSLNRFSIFVQFSIAVLAGVGLDWILVKGFRSAARQIILTFAFLILILFETYVSEPNHIIPATKNSPVGEWLKNLPKNEIILWLPMSNKLNYQSPEIHYFQRLHQKKLVNNLFYNRRKNTIVEKYASLYEELNQHPQIAPTNPKNLTQLKELGVKYIVVFTSIPIEEAARPVPDLKGNPNLSLIKIFQKEKVIFGDFRDDWQNAEIFEIK